MPTWHHAAVHLTGRLRRVEGKARLQNRLVEDRDGVVAGLRTGGGGRESVVAAQMERLSRD